MSLPKRLSALCLCLCLALGLSGCTPAVFGRWVLERSLRRPVRRGKPDEPAQAEGEARRPGTVCGCGQRDQQPR